MLSKILEIENIAPKDKISPLLYSKIESLYENEDYDTVISDINAEFYEESYIDISLLIILICSHLFKSTDFLTDVNSLYKDLNTMLDKYDSSLSPVTNFESYVSKSFTRLNKAMLYSFNKILSVDVEFEQLSTIIDNMNDFNKKFKDIYEIDLAIQKSFISLYQAISTEREVLKTEIKNSEDLSQNNQENTIDEKSNSKDKNTSKIESKYDIRKIASLDWFKLIEKLNMLKVSMKDKGILEQAIIYYDIQKELRKFDPKKYFPGLFFDVYTSIGNKARDIYSFIDKNKDTVEWHLTDQLYQFDKKRFLKKPMAAVSAPEVGTQDFGMFEDELEQIKESDKTLINNLEDMTDSQDIALDNYMTDSQDIAPGEDSNDEIVDDVHDSEQAELESIIDDIDKLF